MIPFGLLLPSWYLHWQTWWLRAVWVLCLLLLVPWAAGHGPANIYCSFTSQCSNMLTFVTSSPWCSFTGLFCSSPPLSWCPLPLSRSCLSIALFLGSAVRFVLRYCLSWAHNYSIAPWVNSHAISQSYLWARYDFFFFRLSFPSRYPLPWLFRASWCVVCRWRVVVDVVLLFNVRVRGLILLLRVFWGETVRNDKTPSWTLTQVGSYSSNH